MRLLGREPAQWVHLLSGFLMLLSPALHLTGDQQGATLALLTAASGFATAALVSGEKAAALVSGLIKAILALALAFHFHLAPDVQAGLMVFVEASVAFYLRTQVIAPTLASPPVPTQAA